MLNLPDSLINDINVIKKYCEKYNVNNVYFINKINTLKYIENFNLDKYGVYNHSTNRITVNPSLEDDGKKVLSHELLHIAGGFNNNVGFNELTTQYFNSVIFKANKGHFTKTDFKMIDKISKLVGFDNFFKCYLLRNDHKFEQLLLTKMEYIDASELLNILNRYYTYFIDLDSRENNNLYDLERKFNKIIKKALKNK